jgi:hypothetical protein
VYLAARWSQATLLLIDNRATWFDVTDASSSLTAGHRPSIAVLLVAVAAATLVVEGLVNDVTVLAWAWRAVGSTLGAALAASVYYQLSLRAPWHPEG